MNNPVRDTFCSYGVMELCVRELASQVDQMRDRLGLQLSCLRTCVVVAEERPRVALCNTFAKLFAPLGLPARAVSTSFGCRVNVAICMQVKLVENVVYSQMCRIESASDFLHVLCYCKVAMKY